MPLMHQNLAQIARWWVLKVILNKTLDDHPIKSLCKSILSNHPSLNSSAFHQNLATLIDDANNNTNNNIQ